MQSYPISFIYNRTGAYPLDEVKNKLCGGKCLSYEQERYLNTSSFSTIHFFPS